MRNLRILKSMKTSDKTTTKTAPPRNLFNELTAGIAAFAEERQGKRTRAVARFPHSADRVFVRVSIWTTVPPFSS
jgi:hypothetical protein